MGYDEKAGVAGDQQERGNARERALWDMVEASLYSVR